LFFSFLHSCQLSFPLILIFSTSIKIVAKYHFVLFFEVFLNTDKALIFIKSFNNIYFHIILLFWTYEI
jgi:hypothetical protein